MEVRLPGDHRNQYISGAGLPVDHEKEKFLVEPAGSPCGLNLSWASGSPGALSGKQPGNSVCLTPKKAPSFNGSMDLTSVIIYRKETSYIISYKFMRVHQKNYAVLGDL